MSNYKLYTGFLAGEMTKEDEKSLIVIITKWKIFNVTPGNDAKDSEDGRKTFYFKTTHRAQDILFLEEKVYDEAWCKSLYETYPGNTKLTIEREVKLC